MAISNMKVTFQCDIQKVWDIVTSFENYSWRSDLDRIEVIDKSKFVEYTKEGYATTFTITTTEPCRRWEFDMENDNMSGHWIGVFTYENGNGRIPHAWNTDIKFAMNVAALSAKYLSRKLGYAKILNQYYNHRSNLMEPEIAVAICSLLGTLIGSLTGIMTANKLVTYRIEQLEEKVKKHNNLVERMIVVEQSAKSAHHRLDELYEER